jgi:hypothetical protein
MRRCAAADRRSLIVCQRGSSRNAIVFDTSRDHMLANIRASLKQRRTTLAGMAAQSSHAPPRFVDSPQDGLLAQFAAELAKLEGPRTRPPPARNPHCADRLIFSGFLHSFP